jgi:hypothetical protein
MTTARRVATVSTAAVVLLTAAACTGSGHKSATSVPASAPSSTASSSAVHKPAKKAAPQRNPFTGIGPVPKTATIAVKIDDTAPGRPQVGIDKADIVYIEAVEGGLTRLAAIFGTNKPTEVGYVRSTRPSDPDLLLQFGKITEAYSGGAHDSLPRVHRSGIRSWSNDAGARFYYRAPHYGDHGYINLALDVRKVSRHTHTPRPKFIGWTFSRHLPHFTQQRAKFMRTVVTGSYNSGTPVEFRWWARLHAYVRFIDGRPQRARDGHYIMAQNLIVQRCRIKSHPRDTDIAGNPSQFTFTMGKGAVSVFRNDRRIEGTWSRPHLHNGTRFYTKAGRRIPLMPGKTWVVLIRKGIRVFS